MTGVQTCALPISSVVLNTETLTPMAPPSTPVNVNTNAISYFAISLSWDRGSDDTESFNIYRSNAGSISYENIQNVDLLTLSFLDEGLNDNTLYYYYIAAQNREGESAGSSVISAQTLTLPVPSKPIGLSINELDSTIITFA